MSSIPFICIYHTFLIHSSIDGHLGCFCILAIVNNGAVNIGVHVSLWTNVFFPWVYTQEWIKYIKYIPNIYPFLGQMVVQFLVFWWTCILFLTVAAPIYIPINHVSGFPFLQILTNIC